MRPTPNPLRTIFVLALAAITSQGWASQYMAAEINLHFISGDEYEVRLLLWRDCQGLPVSSSFAVQYSSPCGSGALTLNLVPGATTDVSPLCVASMAASTCSGGVMPGIQRVEYSALMDLVPCNAWTFQFSICCMVQANNMFTPSAELVTHTTLNNLDLPCRDTPRYMHPGLPLRSSNSPFTLDLLGMIDGPGSAQFALVNLLTSSGAIGPYNAPIFTGPNPYHGLVINNSTGVLSTSANGGAGYWVIVPELRQYDGPNLLASVERTFLMVSSNLNDQPPLATDGALTYVSGSGMVTGPRTIEVPEGGTICATLSCSDPDLVDSVFISSTIASALPGATFSMLDGNPGYLEFCWTAPPGSNGMHPFVVLASDERCPVDQDQYYLYQVLVTPDIANPCLPTAVNGPLMGTTDRLLAYVDPSGSALAWTLPEGRTAARTALYDLHGRVLVERRNAPQGSGTLALPTDLVNGAYVLACGELRTRVLVTR